MMDVPHIGFIIAAYGITAAAIAAMVCVIWLDYRALSADLATLEAHRRDKSGMAS